MASFDGMRAASRFNRRPLGMVDVDESGVTDMLSQAMGAANEMKQQDLMRQKELMNFQNKLQMQRNQPALPPLTRGPGDDVVKGHKTVYAPPTAMQQQFRQDSLRAGPGPGAISAMNADKFNNSMMQAKMKTDEDNARVAQELAAKSEDRAYAETISARRRNEKLTDDKTSMDFRAKEAEKARESKPGQTYNITDPNDPTKQIAVERGPDGKLRPLQLDGQNVGGVAKPGTKLSFEGADPKIQDVRDMAQSALDDIGALMDENGKLRSHAVDATGKSRIPSAVAEYFGLSSLTPNTTKGNVQINSLKSKLVIDLIGKMKAQSRTGATGFGNLSNSDRQVLEKAASKLDPNMSDDDFARELHIVQQNLRKLMAPGANETKGVKDSKDKQTRLQEALSRNGF